MLKAVGLVKEHEGDSYPETDFSYKKLKLRSGHASACVYSDKIKRKLRVVCLSDTHGFHHHINVPNGDILVHSGDLSYYSKSLIDMKDINDWMGKLPHKYKIVIGGNHDECLHPKKVERTQSILSNCIYLQDSSCTVEGLMIYGSPWNIRRGGLFKRANAFTKSISEMREMWANIPDETDILLTHNAPYSMLCRRGYHFGCPYLLKDVFNRINPLLHVFGHDHGGYGCKVGWLGKEGESETCFVNAALAKSYDPPLRDPIVVDFIPQSSKK